MSARTRRGRFIVLEGVDGSGTTTQLARLAEALRADGVAVHTTCEPSTGPVGRLLRQALTRQLPEGELSPETLALLFAADRADHVAREVLPALRRGIVVLSDRYLLSSLAYQGLSTPLAWVEAINGTAARPDLTLFLKVSDRVAEERRRGRGGPPELFEKTQVQRRVARKYLEAIRRRARKERIVPLDGNRPAEEVTEAALWEIRALLGRRRA